MSALFRALSADITPALPAAEGDRAARRVLNRRKLRRMGLPLDLNPWGSCTAEKGRHLWIPDFERKKGIIRPLTEAVGTEPR